jgi:flagellar FliJ protein
MAFHFPLDTLLRLRVSIERKEELTLQRINMAILQLRHELEQLRQERQAAWGEAQLRLRDSAPAAELHFELARDQSAQQRAAHLQQQIAQLELARQEQQRAYRKARQDREILENLRARKREQYDLELNRSEQQRVDDMQLMLRAVREPD